MNSIYDKQGKMIFDGDIVKGRYGRHIIVGICKKSFDGKISFGYYKTKKGCVELTDENFTPLHVLGNKFNPKDEDILQKVNVT